MGRKEFNEKLGNVFVPNTLQTQNPLGMTAFLLTVLPENKPNFLPVMLALCFYQSKSVYKRSLKTTAGRVHQLLHETIFSLGSQIGFPGLLKASFKVNQPYYLFKNRADWYSGVCKVLVGIAKKDQNAEAFPKRIQKILHAIQAQPGEGMDGAIAYVSEAFLIYWEHWVNVNLVKETNISKLKKIINPVISGNAVPQVIAADALQEYEGLELCEGECLNFRFQRWRLFRF